MDILNPKKKFPYEKDTEKAVDKFSADIKNSSKAGFDCVKGKKKKNGF